jgi:hypothetical protein
VFGALVEITKDVNMKTQKIYYGCAAGIMRQVQPIDGKPESGIVAGRNKKLMVKRLVADGILEIIQETPGRHGIIIFKLKAV